MRGAMTIGYLSKCTRPYLSAWNRALREPYKVVHTPLSLIIRVTGVIRRDYWGVDWHLKEVKMDDASGVIQTTLLLRMACMFQNHWLAKNRPMRQHCPGS